MSAPRLSLRARLARVAAVRADVDGAGAGKMLFCAGTPPDDPETALAGAPLATMLLAAPTSGAVGATGTPATVATYSITPASVLASSAGLIGFVRLADNTGAGVMDLPAGLADSGMPVILSALQVFEGGEVKLLSCLIRE